MYKIDYIKKIAAYLLSAATIFSMASATVFANGEAELTDDQVMETSAISGTIDIIKSQDLLDLALRVNSGDDLKGVTVKLTRDIDMRYVDFEPIGTYKNPFEGHFDGQGYTISNLTLDDPYQYSAGLFGYVGYYGIVKNVNVENGFIRWNNYTKIGGYWI